MLKVSLGLCQVSRSPLLRFAFNDLDRSSRYSFHDLENQSIHRIPCELLGLEALIRVHQIPPLINARYCLVRARNERNRIKFCRVTFKIASISISSSKISSLNQIRDATIREQRDHSNVVAYQSSLLVPWSRIRTKGRSVDKMRVINQASSNCFSREREREGREEQINESYVSKTESGSTRLATEWKRRMNGNDR